MVTTLQRLNGEMASAVEVVRRGLVEVRSARGGAGAGTIWHPQGLILTNAHVVGHGPLTVTLPDGGSLPARLLAHDSDRDLAALVVEASGLPSVELADSRSLLPGQWVLALGHPWGVRNAATAGVVIGLGSEWPDAPGYGREWIAVNLPLRLGNSGGPLADVRGRLLGINTMVTGPDIGFAVPVHVAKAFLRDWVGHRD